MCFHKQEGYNCLHVVLSIKENKLAFSNMTSLLLIQSFSFDLTDVEFDGEILAEQLMKK